MPANVEQINVTDYLAAAPQFAEYAQRFGPFFFGVMLVLVGVYLSHTARRGLSVTFSVAGIGFMVFSAMIWSNIIVKPIYLYRLHLDNVPRNDELVLMGGNPLLYR